MGDGKEYHVAPIGNERLDSDCWSGFDHRPLQRFAAVSNLSVSSMSM
jgi:hypothetical protein